MLSCSAQLAQIYGMMVPEVLDFFISTEAETGLIQLSFPLGTEQ